MIVWLVDFDGKMENLALMRLSAYHKRKGDEVILAHGPVWPPCFDIPSKVYISCLFSWNKLAAVGYAGTWGGKATIGGVGVDPKSRLSAEIESCPPDYSLYANSRAIGFISRGCIRSCPWCVVPAKEGLLHRVGTAKSVVGGLASVVFLDNNFLALEDYHSDLVWLSANRVAIDFNQGLDARFIDLGCAKLLATCKWSSEIRIACDSIGMMSVVEKAIAMLDQACVPASRVMVYTLIGYSGVDSDTQRLAFLRDLGVRVFPMGYRDLKTGKEPAKGWDRGLYQKYRRLITRMPFSKPIWSDFAAEVVRGEIVSHVREGDLF